MLGWLLLGALFTVAVVTICVVYLNADVAKQKMKEKGIKKGVIKDIIKSENVVHIKLDGLDTDGSEQEIEFEAESYDRKEIRKGMTIVA